MGTALSLHPERGDEDWAEAAEQLLGAWADPVLRCLKHLLDGYPNGRRARAQDSLVAREGLPLFEGAEDWRPRTNAAE
jgi:hypothetical protein